MNTAAAASLNLAAALIWQKVEYQKVTNHFLRSRLSENGL